MLTILQVNQVLRGVRCGLLGGRRHRFGACKSSARSGNNGIQKHLPLLRSRDGSTGTSSEDCMAVLRSFVRWWRSYGGLFPLTPAGVGVQLLKDAHSLSLRPHHPLMKCVLRSHSILWSITCDDVWHSIVLPKRGGPIALGLASGRAPPPTHPATPSRKRKTISSSEVLIKVGPRSRRLSPRRRPPKAQRRRMPRHRRRTDPRPPARSHDTPRGAILVAIKLAPFFAHGREGSGRCGYDGHMSSSGSDGSEAVERQEQRPQQDISRASGDGRLGCVIWQTTFVVLLLPCHVHRGSRRKSWFATLRLAPRTPVGERQHSGGAHASCQS